MATVLSFIGARLSCLGAIYASGPGKSQFRLTGRNVAFSRGGRNFDLAKFIRGGTATGITAAQVGTFLATITNNYRTLRASIANAANVAAVNAVNIAAGWPANP